MMSDPMETARIVIVRAIDEHGQMGVDVTTPATLNAVEMLGMLDVARQQIFRIMGQNQDRMGDQ